MAEIHVLDGGERPFYTIRSLALRLDVSERMVRKLLHEGQLASYRVGKARRIAPEDVDSFLAERREERSAA